MVGDGILKAAKQGKAPFAFAINGVNNAIDRRFKSN
jgi:hypothetical protein